MTPDRELNKSVQHESLSIKTKHTSVSSSNAVMEITRIKKRTIIKT